MSILIQGAAAAEQWGSEQLNPQRPQSLHPEEVAPSLSNGIRRSADASASVFDEISSHFDREAQQDDSLFAELLDVRHRQQAAVCAYHKMLNQPY